MIWVQPYGKLLKQDMGFDYVINMEGHSGIFKILKHGSVCASIQGSAIDRILYEIIQSKHAGFHIDFVMCIGHFLSKVCLPSQSQYSFVSGSLYSCLLHKISHHCHPSNSLNCKIEDLMDCMNWVLTG